MQWDSREFYYLDKALFYLIMESIYVKILIVSLISKND